MNFEMFCKISFLLVSLAALVALEWSLPSVRLHVPLQIIRRRASVDTLVTVERLFTGMRSHDVSFQSLSVIARILAHCASLWLFARVRPLVPLQVA